jgi:hypothetical protein
MRERPGKECLSDELVETLVNKRHVRLELLLAADKRPHAKRLVAEKRYLPIQEAGHT